MSETEDKTIVTENEVSEPQNNSIAKKKVIVQPRTPAQLATLEKARLAKKTKRESKKEPTPPVDEVEPEPEPEPTDDEPEPDVPPDPESDDEPPPSPPKKVTKKIKPGIRILSR